MHAALDAWERFLHERGQLPELVQCGLMHAQFESIHPFLDGNGRVGRLLITLFLIERGRLSQPLLYLSAYIEKRRQEYYELLQGIRARGDWAAWIRFFLEGVADTSSEAVGRSWRLMDLRERHREKLRDRPRAQRLLDALFVNPYGSVARAERLLGVSNPTARQAVRQLQEAGMLEEVTGRSWGRLYLAKPILRILER